MADRKNTQAIADRATAARRVEDIIQLRLDGFGFAQTREFVREKEAEQGSAWFLANGVEPLSDSQIRRYQQRADDVIAETVAGEREANLARHLAFRRHLYGKALAVGEVRTALAVVQDEAELLGLYPPKRVTGAVAVASIPWDELFPERPLDPIKERLRTLEAQRPCPQPSEPSGGETTP